MSEEDQNVDVTALPKFDMPSYESKMTAKEVKSLAIRHGIPLDLHPVSLTEGWTMDQLPDDSIGLYEQYFEFSGVRVPFSTFLLAVIKHFRVHISQLVPLGLNRLTMFELYYRSLNIVPSVSLFRAFYKISKQGHWFSFEKRVGKNVGGQIFRETFSGLKGWKQRFFFLDRRAIPDAMAWRHHDSDVNDPVPEDGFDASDGGLATTWDFPSFCLIFKDTEGNAVTMSEYLRFPFLSRASITKGPPLTSQDQIEQHTTRPLPSDQTISKKTDHQKMVEVEDPKIVAIRERKARAAAKKKEKKRQGGDGGEGSRPKTKRRKTIARKDGQAASEAISSPEPFRTIDPNKANPSGAAAAATAESPVATQTASPQRPVPRGNNKGESSWHQAYYVPEWFIHRRCRLDTPMLCRELMAHLAPPTVQEESNALNNATALERAWFSLARGALAQTDILERKLRDDHAGCPEKIRWLETQNNKLSQVNNDQSLRIKELEDILAQKDHALVYAERINAEQAQEKAKLVAQLGKTKKENFDCIRQLLPTVVERLFQSHEYKQSLSRPFNLAIQAGWEKGLTEERSEADIVELMSRMENFDAYTDKKMYVEYDKMFEK
ncbi:hypothetical protein Tco_1182260 [Tanacetum coccineum]